MQETPTFIPPNPFPVTQQTTSTQLGEPGSTSSPFGKTPASTARAQGTQACLTPAAGFTCTGAVLTRRCCLPKWHIHLHGPNTVPKLSLRHLRSIPSYPVGCIWKKENGVTERTQAVRNSRCFLGPLQPHEHVALSSKQLSS